MNERVFLDYIEHFVRDALSKTDGSPLAAFKWIDSQMTTTKMALLTLNPTEKTEAALAVHSHFQAIAFRPAPDTVARALDPNAEARQIILNWFEARFMTATAMAKAIGPRSRNSRQFIKEAKSHLARLKKLGYPNIEMLERRITDVDNAST
jgi:hypothetical protein